MSRPSPALRVVVAVVMAMAMGLLARRTSAHDVPNIPVEVSFLKDGTFRMEVPLDAGHLPVMRPYEATTEGPLPVEGLPADLGRAVGTVLRGLLAPGAARFDGAPAAVAAEVHLRTERSSEAGEPDRRVYVLGLTGAIPNGARSFTWSSGVPSGSWALALRLAGSDDVARQFLRGDARSEPFDVTRAVPRSRGQVIVQFVGLGFRHILPDGTDHILFVLGIFLLAARLRPILLQVTAFTVAHTITLALSALHVFSLPSTVVEPLIALSIVYVAVENLVTTSLKPWRPVVVFAFGLLHGMGFAGGLAEIGVPRAELLAALLSFNVGVELGQLAVIGAAFALIGLPLRDKPWYRRYVVVPGSLLIAVAGFLWFVQRVS